MVVLVLVGERHSPRINWRLRCLEKLQELKHQHLGSATDACPADTRKTGGIGSLLLRPRGRSLTNLSIPNEGNLPTTQSQSGQWGPVAANHCLPKDDVVTLHGACLWTQRAILYSCSHHRPIPERAGCTIMRVLETVASDQ